MQNQIEIFEKNLQAKIMRRVYALYLLRRVVRPVALRSYALGSAALGLGLSISISNIVHNAPRSTRVGDYYAFSSSAWMHASFLIQALCGAIIILALWFFKDVAGIRLPRTSKLKLGWF